MLRPVFCRCGVHPACKGTVECTQVLIAYLLGNFLNLGIGVSKKSACLIYSQQPNDGVEIRACAVGDDTNHLPVAVSESFCQTIQCQSCVVGLNIAEEFCMTVVPADRVGGR